jgi:hypothetical protein
LKNNRLTAEEPHTPDNLDWSVDPYGYMGTRLRQLRDSDNIPEGYWYNLLDHVRDAVEEAKLGKTTIAQLNTVIKDMRAELDYFHNQPVPEPFSDAIETHLTIKDGILTLESGKQVPCPPELLRILNS